MLALLVRSSTLQKHCILPLSIAIEGAQTDCDSVLNSWLETRSYIVGYVLLHLTAYYSVLWHDKPLRVFHRSSFSGAFQKFHDEQHWSVLLSGVKNRTMTITIAFKCTSEYIPLSTFWSCQSWLYSAR